MSLEIGTLALSQVLFYFVFFFPVLVTKSRALGMLGKSSTTELYLLPQTDPERFLKQNAVILVSVKCYETYLREE